MALIERQITIPDIKKINGETNDTFVSDQTSAWQCMKDIHQCFIDSGLTFIPEISTVNFDEQLIFDLPISLDLNPNPDITMFYYGNLYYSFNDDDQADNPLYLKISPKLNMKSPKYNNSTYYLKNIFAFDMDVRVINSLETDTTLFSFSNLSSSVYASINPTNTLGYGWTRSLINYGNNLCICSYNKNNFYFSFLPNSKIVLNVNAQPHITSSDSIFYGDDVRTSYIGFYIERDKSKVSALRLSSGTSSYSSASGSLPLSSAFGKKKYNQIFSNLKSLNNFNSVDGVRVPFLEYGNIIHDNDSNSINGSVFKSIMLDTEKSTIVESSNLLVTQSSLIGTSNIKYEIELQNGEVGKYISYSTKDNYLEYNTNVDFLIRYE